MNSIAIAGSYRPEMKITEDDDWLTIESFGCWAGSHDSPNSEREIEMRLDTAALHRDQSGEVTRAIITLAPPSREEIVLIMEQLHKLLGQTIRTADTTAAQPKATGPLSGKLKSNK